MSKVLIIAIVVGIVLLAGAGIYVVSSDNSKNVSPENVEMAKDINNAVNKAEENPNNQPNTDNTPKSYKTLKAMVDMGVPMKCTYKIAGNEMEGYIKGKQWRGKITTADGMMGEVILKDECLYSWDIKTKQGMKMCFESTDGKSVWDQPTGDVEMDYKCVPAVITDSTFALPTDVNFINLDEMMKDVDLQNLQNQIGE